MSTQSQLDTLTPREHEVLALVCAGKANKCIAGDLNLSQRTIEIHRARVMQKMNARSLAHLVCAMEKHRRDVSDQNLIDLIDAAMRAYPIFQRQAS